MNTTTIYIVRHGETLMNHFDRMQGWIDAELTDKGRKQAITTGKTLRTTSFDSVYSSDLGRAIETRKLILDQLDTPPKKIFTNKIFREVFFGFFEGLDSSQTWRAVGASKHIETQEGIIEKYDFKTARQLMHELDPEHLAETYDQVIHRWQQGIRLIHQQSPQNARVLLITHGTFIRTLADFKHINTIKNYPENGSVSKIAVTDTHFELTQYNGKSI